jgi:hypothetical protein
MVLKNALRSFCKALLEQRLVLDVEPEDRRIHVPVPPCVSQRCLCFAYSAKPMHDDRTTASITTKEIVYFF